MVLTLLIPELRYAHKAKHDDVMNTSENIANHPEIVIIINPLLHQSIFQMRQQCPIES